MAVLVTRSAPGDQATLKRLRERGIAALSSPALIVEECPPPEPDWTGVQALAVSSAAGAHAIRAYDAAKHLLVLAVGDQTAAELRGAGFQNVQSAQGDGAALVAAATARLSPEEGGVVHIRGREAAVDIAAELAQRGFKTQSLLVYRAIPARSLSDEAAAAIRDGDVNVVVFHSRAGAEAFLSLAAKSALCGYFNTMAAVALSGRVAGALDGAAWREIRIASAPHEESLLALIASDA